MVIAPLDRKLLRNLGEMKGQVFTIALVVAAGIAAFVATKTTYGSLIKAQDAFYQESRFADVWAHAERVPDRRLADIRAIPGVALATSTVSGPITMPLADRLVPATGVVQSLPPEGEPALNVVRLDAGRMPEATRSYEVLVSQAFAQANELVPGDELPAILNGRRRTLRVVGVAVSPEHTIAISPGAFTVDHAGYGVLFMNRQGVAAAFDLEGSFNAVAIDVEPGASEQEVISRLDRLLEPYGGTGAYPRAKQLSNFFLSQELMQLDNMATTVPPIFLAVAAFLLNVVLGRLVQLQRGQIAALKALGYSNREIGMHFLKLATVVVTIGAVLGLAVGKWLGTGMVSLYTEYFRFPRLEHELDFSTVATALLVSAGSGIFGTLFVVRSILRLAPAEAMQPPAPGRFRQGLLERILPRMLFGPMARMVYRDLRRRPLRLVFSVLGLSAGIGINVVGLFFNDAMTYLVDVYMHESMRWDVQVVLREPLSEQAVREIEAFPYVLRAEGNRTVPVRAISGHHERDVALHGYPEDGTLAQVLDMEGQPVEIPEHGLLVTRLLAERLEVGIGDRITFEVREGDRPTVDAPIAGLLEEALGLNVHATNATLEEILGTTPLANTVLLAIEPGHEDEVIARLRRQPMVAGIVRKDAVIEQFREQSSGQMFIFTLVFIISTTVIVVGVVYNNARVTLSMKERELASMRVLGFTRAEISLVLIGELAVHVALAIPLGLWLGTLWSEGIAGMSDPEQYRLPVMISARTYAFSTVVALAAAIVSALLVRRKLYRLDLTAVLKSRE